MRAYAVVSIAAFALSLGAWAAQAKPASFAGTYVGGDRDYRQEVTIKAKPDGVFEIEASVGMQSYSGYVAATGKVEGDVLKARSEPEEGQTCALTLSRTKKGLKVMGDNCNNFHGASCEFDGDYRRKR